jgi:predicted RNase H-like HicB family nuclease
MEFKTREEALDNARQFMELHLKHMPDFDGICEVRPFEEEVQA